MNDALLSGSVDFFSLGVPGLMTIRDRTKRTSDAKGVSGLNAEQPNFYAAFLGALKEATDMANKTKGNGRGVLAHLKGQDAAPRANGNPTLTP